MNANTLSIGQTVYFHASCAAMLRGAAGYTVATVIGFKGKSVQVKETLSGKVGTIPIYMAKIDWPAV